MKHALALVLVAVLATFSIETSYAQGAAGAAGLEGSWQGALTAGANTLRIGLVVTGSAAGGYNATAVSIDQDGARFPVQTITLKGSAVRFEIPAIKVTYDGTLSPDGSELAGTFTQGAATPLNFRRVDRLDPPPTFGDAELAAVREVITSYFDAFTKKDFDRLGSLFQAPFTNWNVGGGPRVTATVEEMVTGYRGLRGSLDGTDYAASTAPRMVITPLTANSAMVDIHWRRVKADGSLFGEGGEILTVARTTAGWKINGNIARSLSQFAKTF